MVKILKFKKKKEKKAKHIDLLIPSMQKINGVDVPCYAIANRHIEEWLDRGTIDGKEVTATQAEFLDAIIYNMFTNVEHFEGGKENLKMLIARAENPKFAKWFYKQAEKAGDLGKWQQAK